MVVFKCIHFLLRSKIAPPTWLWFVMWVCAHKHWLYCCSSPQPSKPSGNSQESCILGRTVHTLNPSTGSCDLNLQKEWRNDVTCMCMFILCEFPAHPWTKNKLSTQFVSASPSSIPVLLIEKELQWLWANIWYNHSDLFHSTIVGLIN